MDNSLEKSKAVGLARLAQGRHRDRATPFVRFAEFEAARNVARGRARVLIGFLWASGARVSEALAVTPACIDVQQGTIRCRTLKRRRADGSGMKQVYRSVPLQGGASKYLAEILGLIVDRHIRADDRIFPWTRQRAYQVVRAAFLAVGVPPDRARPHALRHGHAVHAINNRAPLNVIQKALGHASIHTTSLYLDVTAEDVAREYSAIAW